MRLALVSVLSLAATSLTAQTIAQPALAESDLAEFHNLVQACKPLGQPFALFGTDVPPPQWPLPLRLVRLDPRVLFGTPYDPKTEAPLLAIDLTEFHLLPQVDAVNTWPADSSWAYTLCELLGHELAEAVEYARLMDSMPAGPAPDARFLTVRRRAHQVGLDMEREVARRQGTRRDSTGLAYGRTRSCFLDTDSRRPSAAIVLGSNTVLWNLRDANVYQVRYLAGIDACGVF